MQRIFLFKKYVLAEFMKGIIQIAPIIEDVPFKTITTDIMDWLDANITTDLPGGMFETDEDMVMAFCHEIVHGIPSVRDLNLSRYERERGVQVDDARRPAFVGSSAFERTPKMHDFIDLDALSGNVYRALMKEEGAELPEAIIEKK